MIDSTNKYIDNAIEKEPWKDFGFSGGDYCLVTLHRPSNVDDISNLKDILAGLSEISNTIKLFFSIHPRTKKNILKYKIFMSNNIDILDAMPYLDFLNVMKNSKVIFTDSGGIQEESTVLKITFQRVFNCGVYGEYPIG